MLNCPFRSRSFPNDSETPSSIELHPPSTDSPSAFPKDEGIAPQHKVLDAATVFLETLSNYLLVGSLPVDCSTADLGHRRDVWQELYAQDLDFLKGQQHIKALVGKKWIRVFLGALQSNSRACLRVYVLPDDVGRRYVEKGDRTLRKHLMRLIEELDLSLQAWTGQDRSVNRATSIDPYQPENTNHSGQSQDSLFYLFNTLLSPSPNPADITCFASKQAVNAVFESGGFSGLKTALYPYQRRTVATMIQREVQPAKGLDPRLEPLRTPTNEEFYYDRQNGLLYKDKIEYDETRGGILAESMGLGKTLICLSTILATKGHWPSIPPEFSLGRHPVRPHTASLMQMAATAMGHEQIPWRKLFQDLARQGEEHRNCVKVLEDNIGSYYIPSTIISRRKSGPTEQKGKTIRLSNITLIVVPQNLLSQWMVELEKHFEEGSFVTLFVESNDSRMPSAQKLLKYDIIIMSRSRFLSEMFPNGTVPARVSSKGGCKCSLDEDCHCTSSAEYQSPLKDLHFLRIIMDEGHEFSSGKKTQTYWALSKIHVERKWIVSGTPTSGLMGVEVGTAAHETSKMSATDVNLSETLAARRYEPGFVQEKKDLEALRVLVVGFLHLKPWSNSKGDDPASWTTYIMPKDECRKPASLKALLQSLVVRHRIEDIEIDVQLPPLHNKVVYLQPSWHDKISINLFILTLIVNAVTSERSDEDYMFHAKNRQVLNRLINNLRQSGFYWTSFTQEDISKTLGVARQYLEHHPNPAAGCAISDRLLLEEAVSVGEIVLASPSWKALSSLHEMGLFVDGFTEACNKAWSLVLGQQREPMLIGATQLTKAQKWVDRHLYLSAESLERDLEGVGTKTMKKSWREVFGLADEVTQDPPTKANLYQSPKTKRPAHLMAPRLTARLTVSRARPALAILETEKLQKRNAQTADPANGPKLKSAMKTTSRISTKPITLETPIIRSTLRGTASAKLSYLLDRVIALHSEEKIMIFYEGDQIAYYIAQALEILDIRFLIYTRTLDLSLKNAYIATFNATSTFRVMLMNIHEAAHGLHIASASRVFFVNPVWQPNVEAQAIKRAHRIGQTRPVYVETLVLKDTLEDQMLQRRKGMTAQEHLKAEKSLLDDDTMSSIIRNARLIPLPQNDLHAMSAQVADLQKSQPLFGQSNTGVSETEDPYADLIFPVETPKAVRKSRERLARSLKTQAASQDGPKRKNEWDDSSDLEESSGPTKRRRLASVSVETGPGRKRVGFALDGAMEIDSLSGSNNATGESASIVSPP